MTIIKNHRGLFILLFLGFILHSILALVPPINGDEATFWEWSRHLALGYYAHPPMTSWLIALVTGIFGIFKYSVRLTSILLHLGTIVFVYLIALDILREKKPALISALIYALMPLSIVLGTVIATDSNLILCFTAASYFVKKAIIDEKKRYWYWAAIACGLMLLTKFMAFLFFPGVFLFLLVNRDYRKQILQKEPYLAFLLSFLVFSPHIYWNATHKWLTFQFNFFVRHQDQEFNLINPLTYIAGQMLAASPVVFIVLITALITIVIRKYRAPAIGGLSQQSADALLLFSYLTGFPLLFYIPTSFRSEIGAHWAAFIYPTASVLVAAFLYLDRGKIQAQVLQKTRTFWACLISMALISIPIYIIVVFPRILPDRMIYTPKVYTKKAPIGSHYFGWKEIGNRIDELKTEWSKRPEGLFFTSSDYSLASMLGFYTPSHPNFYLMAITDNVVHGKSYILWARGKKKPGANTIYVSDVPDSFKGDVEPYFKRIQHLEPLVVRESDGRILRVFYLTVGYHYIGGEPDTISLW